MCWFRHVPCRSSVARPETPHASTLVRGNAIVKTLTIAFPRRAPSIPELIDNYVGALCSTIGYVVALLLIAVRSQDALGGRLAAVLVALGALLRQRGEPAPVVYVQGVLNDLTTVIGPAALLSFATSFPDGGPRTGFPRTAWFVGLILAVPVAAYGLWAIAADFLAAPAPSSRCRSPRCCALCARAPERSGSAYGGLPLRSR